jgi:glycosyltransferase involved in cell wall biosynthesis
LHRAEREFVNYGTKEYDDTLRTAFVNAEAVLVVNPLIGAMVSPYTKRVCIIPSGFDGARFPKFPPASPCNSGTRLQILFAGLVGEPMKGFDVLREACSRLWSKRLDFELIATSDPPGQVNPFTRFIGWQSQSTLPAVIRDADVLAFPTIAEEALGRTAVEAMGASRPVVASRIGGLQFTVVDGATGLLFEPGNVEDLCRKLERLLDDPQLRDRMGRAGRERFEEHYTWDSILEKHYLPLLGEPSRRALDVKRQPP